MRLALNLDADYSYHYFMYFGTHRNSFRSEKRGSPSERLVVIIQVEGIGRTSGTEK